MTWKDVEAAFASWADVVVPWAAPDVTNESAPSPPAAALDRAHAALVVAGWRDGDAVGNLDAARSACAELVAGWSGICAVPDDVIAMLGLHIDAAATAIALFSASQNGPDAGSGGGDPVQRAIVADWGRPCSHQPRLPVRATALATVQAHVDGKRRSGGKLTREHLVLYHNLMQPPAGSASVAAAHPIRRIDTLAFVAACVCGRADELYMEMPTSVLSSMRGRPCRTRDHGTPPPLPASARLVPLMPLLSKPAVLYTTGPTHEDELVLAVRGSIVGRLRGCGGLVVPIPAHDATEQLAVVCDASGRCVVVSTTRNGLMRVGEFRLDVPADVAAEEDEDGRRIAWMDAALARGSSDVILTWGGTDALRGLPTWSCFAGFCPAALVDADRALFYETSVDDAELSTPSAAAVHDSPNFARHGSQLTLWSHTTEDESTGERRWDTQRTLLHTASATALQLPAALAADGIDVADVWGAPRHYMAMVRGGASECWRVVLVKEGAVRSEHALAESARVHSACMLFVHSRW